MKNHKIKDFEFKDQKLSVRCGAAKNAKTAASTLHALASDTSSLVRYEVALHKNTTQETLFVLLGDSSSTVRMMVAKHPNVSPEMLKFLSKDRNALVRIAVAENFKTPTEVIEDLVVYTIPEYEALLRAAARNTATPTRLLRKFADNPDESIRICVAINPKLPPEVFAGLLKDGNPEVRKAAKQILASKKK